MLKKMLLIFMAITVFIAVSTPSVTDARPRLGGGFKSGKKFYTPTTPKGNISKTSPAKSGSAKTGTTPKRGFFSGGSFAKGLMIGGLAGLLFGGMFGHMGFLGNILGLLVNVFAIYLLIIVIAGIFRYFRNRKPDQNRRRY